MEIHAATHREIFNGSTMKIRFDSWNWIEIWIEHSISPSSLGLFLFYFNCISILLIPQLKHPRTWDSQGPIWSQDPKLRHHHAIGILLWHIGSCSSLWSSGRTVRPICRFGLPVSRNNFLTDQLAVDVVIFPSASFLIRNIAARTGHQVGTWKIGVPGTSTLPIGIATFL